MSKYKVHLRFKTRHGSTNCTAEVQIPDNLDYKVGNSNFNQEMLNIVGNALPQIVAGTDWRKNGYILETYHSPQKL